MEGVLDDVVPSESDMSALVQFWLGGIYGPQSVPSFESGDVRIIRILYELSLLNQKRDRTAKMATSNAQNRQLEYARQNDALARLLCSIGLCDAHNTTAGKLYHSKVHGHEAAVFDDPQKQYVLRLCGELTNLAQTLQLDCTDFCAITHAMSDLDASLEECEALPADDHIRQGCTYYELCDKKKYLQKLLKSCEKQREAQRVATEDKSKSQAYFSGKSQEYAFMLSQLDEELNARGLHSDLFHSSLQRQFDEISRLEQETRAKQEALKVFGQLPPDKSLLMSKIENARCELAQLEQCFEESVSKLRLDLDG